LEEEEAASSLEVDRFQVELREEDEASVVNGFSEAAIEIRQPWISL
jgi:hypothetical protein